MPQAVRNALAEIFQTQGSMTPEDAEQYLQKLEKTGRYKQETW
jgi:sulfite reductase alpha subunit-like flavoprotein